MSSDLFFVELAVTYAAIEHTPARDQTTVDVYAGVRVYAAETELTLITGPMSQDREWVDPIVGLDARFPTGKWRFGVRADIGGFGAGSDLSWSTVLAANYEFTDLFSIALGYRWFDIDYQSGSGADAFLFDVQLTGPFVAFVFRF